MIRLKIPNLALRACFKRLGGGLPIRGPAALTADSRGSVRSLPVGQTLSERSLLKHPLRTPLPWVGLALATGLFYLAVAAWGFGVTGFPLDDAWIHQTYARNLARSGQLAFVPGVPSAGSTAPLWSFCLSLGYWLGLPFLGWTYGLGLVLLALTGWTVARLGTCLFPEHPLVGLWAGLFCIGEWHLVWAAVSGMETMLFIWLSLFLVERYLAGEPNKNAPVTDHVTSNQLASRFRAEGPLWAVYVSPFTPFGLGILGGLLILTRPEGLGLVGLVGLDMAYRCWRQPSPNPSARWFYLGQRWAWVVAGISLLLIPYVGLHLQATGLPFPNTFYAKQAEYGVILKTFPLWWRLFGHFGAPETVQGVFRVIFIGAQLLLLPGLCFGAWLTYRERRAELLLLWLWWSGYLLLYGLRLPVTYQHGRYQIPAIAWVILLGVWGTVRLAGRPRSTSPGHLLRRVAGRTLSLALLLLVPLFLVIGAQAYGRDVRFIESEMVATAKWLHEQAAPDALIAAHDIGAIGYFTERPLLDLAGLITPEVIPIIRDEAALFEFITSRQADYLVTFPGWYPHLTGQPELMLLYQINSPWSPQAGGENMAVYRIAAPVER